MIELKDITKYYGEEKVLDGISMQVKAGRSFVILGGSGSGKSTLLRVIAGLESVDSGILLVGNKNVTDISHKIWKKLRAQIGIVFQEGALFDSLNIRDNVGYHLIDEGGWSREEIDATVYRVLSSVGLAHTMYLMPSELSGGMRRRVAIARAIVAEPRILLYDEPTSGLDPVTSRTICDLIVKLRDINGVTSIIVTHDLNAACYFAGYGTEIDDNGEIQFVGETQNFRYVHTLFGFLHQGRMIFSGSRDNLLLSLDPHIRSMLNSPSPGKAGR